MKIEESAFAKLNLSLDIVSRMSSGYHNMKMVMQGVTLSDDVTIECGKGSGIVTETNLSYVPRDGRNIASRAADVFFSHTGITGYFTHIRIHKRIPVCAGMGGGSSDGAAVLRGLNRMFGAGLDEKTLCDLAGTIGSDVPFCVAGGTALAEGRGDRLRSLRPLPECYIVICKPFFSISTPELFSKINCGKISRRPDTIGMLHAIELGDLGGVARRMYNVFEDVLQRHPKEIESIKARLLQLGALGSVMTGAGSAVFGIFSDKTAAENAFLEMRGGYTNCFLTGPRARTSV